MSGGRTALRDATAPDHARLDAVFDRFDLADARSYGGFLSAHAAALLAVEPQLDAHGIAALIPDWPERRRGELIRADLASLGLEVPAPLAAPELASEAALWGAAYVVEGSRLGGAVLARHVGPGLPTAYLAAAQPKGAWRAFIAMLDAAVADDDRLTEAAAGAHATFALFEAAGLHYLNQLESCDR